MGAPLLRIWFFQLLDFEWFELTGSRRENQRLTAAREQAQTKDTGAHPSLHHETFYP